MEVEFYIRNMVCNRCIRMLRQELQHMGISLRLAELGRLVIDSDQMRLEEDKALVSSVVKKIGFSLIQDPDAILVERIKHTLITWVASLPLQRSKKLSVFLSERFNMGYSKISRTFSSLESVTVERYFIKLKIEKVKELLHDRTYNFSEIAQLLDYSSVNHLSGQFKKETGLNLGNYRKLKLNRRQPLDTIL